MNDGHGALRFDDDVWRCMVPCTQTGIDFRPQWTELDEIVDHCHTEYKVGVSTAGVS